MNLKDTYEYRECGAQIVKCPVCGHDTLDCCWVCEYCGWEYDGVTGENEYSSANKNTVQEYRRQYEASPDFRSMVCPMCGRKTLDCFGICSNCGRAYDDSPTGETK